MIFFQKNHLVVNVLYLNYSYVMITLVRMFNIVYNFIMKKYLNKLILPCGDCIIDGERFHSWLIFGLFWLNISQDRRHISFEYLPF